MEAKGNANRNQRFGIKLSAKRWKMFNIRKAAEAVISPYLIQSVGFKKRRTD